MKKYTLRKNVTDCCIITPFQLQMRKNISQTEASAIFFQKDNFQSYISFTTKLLVNLDYLFRSSYMSV